MTHPYAHMAFLSHQKPPRTITLLVDALGGAASRPGIQSMPALLEVHKRVGLPDGIGHAAIVGRAIGFPHSDNKR